MNAIDAYLAELEMEAATTRRILEAVPESKFDWRPHEKGMSMAELCGHIAFTPAGMPHILGGDGFDVSDIPAPEAPPKTLAEVLAGHDASTGACAEWLAGLGAKAGEMWRLTKGDQELMAMPRVTAIRFFLFNHLYHHRGQLSTYLRATGQAVPSVYGPTADVDPFA